MTPKKPNPAPSAIKTADEVTDAELAKAIGGTKADSGKVMVHDIAVTKHVDKSSSNLF